MRCSSCRDAGQRHPAGLVPVGGARRGGRRPPPAAPGRAVPAARPRRRRRCRTRAGGRGRRRPGRWPGSAAASPVGPPDHRVRQRGVVLRRTRASREASTTTESGGRRASSAATKVWMPPCRGGKSLVTTRVRVTAVQPFPVARPGRPAAPSVGWEPKNHCQAAGGSGSERLVTASPRCIAMKASGSRVRSSACTSARASICRETRFCTGVDTSVPTASRNRTSGDDPRVTGPIGARPAEQRGDRQQPAEQRPHRRAAPSAPIERAGEDVVGGHVAELVGGDRLDLVVGQPVEHRVVDDDPPGRAEAGHVGVQRRRAPAGVGDEHVLHRGAVLARRGPAGRCAADRPASSSKRLNAGSITTGQRNDPTTTSAAAPTAGPGPPRPRRAAGQPDEGQQRRARSGRRRCRWRRRRRAATGPSSRVDSP